MKLTAYIIDTFTSTRFKGNPTLVCIIETKPAYKTMYAIAKELNFPVTAFVEICKRDEKHAIRYFTVTGEISACGHATLAAAKVIFELTGRKSAKFKTIKNIIIDTYLNGNSIFMTYPKYEMATIDVSLKLLKSLGLKNYKSAGFCKELETLFIELENPHILRRLRPKYKLLVESTNHLKEVVVTSVSDIENYDFLLRSFCPWIGINEDTVTGSVHSALAIFWKNRLNKTALTAYQASERGGEVFVKFLDDKIELGGKSMTVLKGELSI